VVRVWPWLLFTSARGQHLPAPPHRRVCVRPPWRVALCVRPVPGLTTASGFIGYTSSGCLERVALLGVSWRQPTVTRPHLCGPVCVPTGCRRHQLLARVRGVLVCAVHCAPRLARASPPCDRAGDSGQQRQNQFCAPRELVLDPCVPRHIFGVSSTSTIDWCTARVCLEPGSGTWFPTFSRSCSFWVFRTRSDPSPAGSDPAPLLTGHLLGHPAISTRQIPRIRPHPPSDDAAPDPRPHPVRAHGVSNPAQTWREPARARLQPRCTRARPGGRSGRHSGSGYDPSRRARQRHRKRTSARVWPVASPQRSAHVRTGVRWRSFSSPGRPGTLGGWSPTPARPEPAPPLPRARTTCFLGRCGGGQRHRSARCHRRW